MDWSPNSGRWMTRTEENKKQKSSDSLISKCTLIGDQIAFPSMNHSAQERRAFAIGLE
jgi:hypothetical protein